MKELIELKKGDKLYYRGMGWGSETYVFNIFEYDGDIIIHANNGVKRKYKDVINNIGNLCISKKAINEKLISIGTSCTLIP